MRYPAFVAEMGLPANRSKLYAGVWAGYVIAAAFAVLAFGAVVFDVSPYGYAFAWMVVIKMVINTVVLVVLRRGAPGALELMALDMTTDVLLMTAAMYYTGGPSSPISPVYVIEVTVTALLSNVGVTVLVASGIILAFTGMCVLVAAGVLPYVPPPGLGVMDAPQIVVYVAFAIFAVGTPTIFTLRILTRLRSKERALEARTAELIEAGKQRSVFLASVTHELRTPIHGIQGLSDLIAAGVYGPTSERQREAAASIKRSSQSLLQLVDDLLALVRADVGRLEPKVAPLDLPDLIEQVVASVQWMLGAKKLTLTTQLPEGARDATIVSDRRLVGHVLVNLVANAAKFTPEGGKVTVSARVVGGGEWLELVVSDTGIGIPDDKREEIFEAFRQLDMSDERTYGGVGLGLALVKRLCSLLGGTVEVASVVGKGSTFTVRLPARMLEESQEL